MLATIQNNALAATKAPELSDLVNAWLEGRSPTTIRAYRSDLLHFARFVGVETVDDAARTLLSGGRGAANLLGLRYRNAQRSEGLSPATINRRLAALRSLVKVGRMLDLIEWSLDVPSLKAESYRDTKGPGAGGFSALLLVAQGQRNRFKAARDTAIAWLLFSPALRRAEVCELDLTDVDLAGSRVSIMGKGRTERESVTIPADAVEALAAWIELRGDDPGPLFVNASRSHKRARLTADGVWHVIRTLGRKAGLGDVRPHGLRHAGITTALDATNGNVRAVASFSRHKDVRVVSRYDDARKDLGGAVAKSVAAAVGLA